MGVGDKIDAMFGDPYENCKLTTDPEIADDYYDKTSFKDLEPHEFAWIASGICVFFAVVLSIYQIHKHLKNYHNPNHQRFIVRILMMVPIYAIDSFLSFRFYWISIYFDLVRDTYEAFVINTFFCLMVEYAGGYSAAKEIFIEKGAFKLLFPLKCITVPQSRGVLRVLKRLTLQYVIIRPITAIIAVILEAFNVYCPGNWNFSRGYIYITFTLFVSVTLAMYALVMFYSICSKQMAPYKPVGKFLSVKFVIFLSFWQSIVVAGLVYLKVFKATTHWSTDDVSTGVQNFLISVEMLIAAIAHIYVFAVDDYIKPGQTTPVFKTLLHVFKPHDIALDIYHSFYPRKTKNKLKMKKLSEQENSQPTDADGANATTVVNVEQGEGGAPANLLRTSTQSDFPESESKSKPFV